MKAFRHILALDLVLDEGADERAPGGAVTMGLCGHWEHTGPCRWPHHTSIEAAEQGHRVSVTFECTDRERAEVETRIRAALAEGGLTGPDGKRSSWKISDSLE